MSKFYLVGFAARPFRNLQFGRIFSVLLFSLFSLVASGQNLGFEAPSSTPPNNWTAVTGTWFTNTNPVFVRTGVQSMGITDPATTGTTIGTVNPFVTTTAAGNYLITIGWGKASTPSNGLVHFGYRSGTTNTLNPTTTTAGQPANLNDVTWSRITSVSAATVAAGSYGISARAFRSATTPSTTVYLDDIIIYASTSNIPDFSAPNAATGVTATGNTISWTNGTDNGAPASGIGGVVIIRTDGAGANPPTLNDQAMYNPAGGAAGVSSFFQNGVTWTVVANINDATTTSFTDASAGAGPYTYMVFMRDMAYNYSAAASTPQAPCTTPPTAGTTNVNPSALVCQGTQRSIFLTGNSFGSGQTYTLQSSSTQTGTYTDIGTASSAPNFTVAPTNTTWYRIKVTCGTSTSFSTPVEASTISGLSGTYTIGGPAGPNNFATFSDAIAALGCGITGPVIFNVAPGTYTEQVSIPQVVGASSTNTITFNGTGVTLSPTTSTGARHVILLDGADHVRLNNFTLTASTGTWGWGVFLTNGADSNIISGNTINLSTSNITANNYGGIVITGSATSFATSGNNGNYNTIINNTINGGYHGISLYGSSTAGAQNIGNKVLGNTIRDFYQNGVNMLYQEDAVISKNDISRPTRTTSTTTAGVFVSTGNIGTLVEKNRIHNLYDAMTTNTSTTYGIYVAADGTAGNENLLINNAIYNINSNGIVYGIYNTAGPFMNAYHNTIVLDFAGTTTGATYGFYQTGAAASIDFRNNIIYLTRGGTGTKRAIYLVTTTSTVSSNNNVIWFAPAAGTNNNFGQFGTTNYATFTDWQTANSSAYDQQSLNVDPLFNNPAAGDFLPNNGVIAAAGANVGVLTDILDGTRNASSPTPGAWEAEPPTASELSVVMLKLPTVQDCYSATETVRVTIRNNSATPQNFVTKPATVGGNVTGPNPQTFTPVTINTGTLAPGDSLDVTLSTTYNMSAQGTYTFTTWVNTAGDAVPQNDTLYNQDRVVAPVEAGTLTSSNASFCVVNGIPTLTLSGNTGANIQFQQATSPTGPWTNVGTNSTTYTPGTGITQTMYYRAIGNCLANSDTSNTVMVEYFNPLVLTTTPASRCGVGTVTLGATGSAGATLTWYETPTGGSPIGTGNSFTTPVLSNTTTFYVSAKFGAGVQSLGAASPNAFPNSGTNSSLTAGMEFEVLGSGATIQSVTIFPTVAVGTPFKIAIRTGSGTGPAIDTFEAVTTVQGTVAAPIAQEVPVNFTLAPGTYYMTFLGGAMTAPLTGTAVYPGALRNNPSTGATFPYTLPGSLSIINGTLTNVWYYFYDWKITTGCESPRTAVDATLSNPPALTINADTTICNNTVLPLTASTGAASYNNFIWSPQANLFTDAAATIPYTGGSSTTVYVKTNAEGTYEYILLANNTSTNCANSDTVNVTIIPDSVVLNASQAELCVTGSSTLTVSPGSGFGNATFQWFSSPDSVTFTPIAGATGLSYTTPTLTTTTYYKVEIRIGGTVLCAQPARSIKVNNPVLLTTTPATRCGPGTLTLSATGSAGAGFNWYTAATGGTLVGSGANFTTPILNNTTTYYVAAANGGGVQNLGVVSPANLPNSGTNSSLTAGMIFNVITSGTTIQSVKIYPTVAVGTPFKIVVRTGTATGAVVQTFEALTTVQGTVAAPIAQEVPVNFTLPSGTYAMTFFGGAMTAPLSGTAIYPGALRNNPATGATFPYTIPGVLSITNGSLTNVWYYFYDWKIGTGCESARQAVTATVTPAPTFNVLDSVTICNNAIQALTVNSPVANFNSYVWTPATNLYTDAAATIPYTGGSASTVYIRTATAGTYWYTINASNSTTTCTGIDSVKVVVLPGNITVQATPSQICTQGSTFLSITPATGYENAQFQWQISTNGGTTYTNITGATSSTYATPVISQTTMYKVQIRNSAGVVCQEPTVTVTVNTPQVLTSAGAINCGPGSVTLNATGSAGTTLNWYTSTQGGAPVGTGTTFTTPNLTATTTYYVSATSGGAIQSLGPIAPGQIGTATSQTTLNSGIRFDALNLSGTQIQSVDIFPTASVGTAFQIAVIQGPLTTGAIVNGANGQPLVYNGVTTVQGTAANPIAQTVPVNFQVPAGFDYIMVFKTTNPGALRNSPATAAAFPYSIPSEISLNGSTTANTYQFFYNWRIGSGCESPRTAVTATISANTAITTQPTAQSVCSGATLQLTVGGAGAGVTYQWFKDGQPIANSNNDTLTIVNAQPANAGQYTVTLTGSCGTVTSQAVTVNVSGQNTWLGAVSSDWHTAANWCGSIPTQTSDIVIPGGTPFQPVVNALADVRNISVSAGATLTINANGFLNIWGNYQNQGTLTAQNGFIGFKGTTAKTASALNAGTVVINGTGGVSLQGDWTVGTLILENGNITLNGSSLALTASAMGSPASHIITNGVGSVRALNVLSGRTIGVGADATSYNPVVITNGQGRDYTVRVVVGITPNITNSARAINRTWTVLPSSAVTAPVELTFQWADAHGNASVTAGGSMEVGVNSNAPGGFWNILTPPGGLTPAGGTADRSVTILTTTFGNFVVSSPGGFTYPLSTPGVDVEVSSVQLMPNLVQSQTTMRVKLTRSARVQWSVVDASGKVVRQWAGSYTAGTTDEKLNLINLSKGAYFLMGHTQKGRTQTVRLVKE